VQLSKASPLSIDVMTIRAEFPGPRAHFHRRCLSPVLARRPVRTWSPNPIVSGCIPSVWGQTTPDAMQMTTNRVLKTATTAMLLVI